MSFFRLLKTTAKHAVVDMQSRRVDHEHKIQAMKAVHSMEAFNGQRLSKHLKKTADDYARDVFHSKRYAPWLYVYAMAQGEFKEGWIPDNFFGKVVSPRVNKALRIATDFKSFTNVVLQTAALPDLAYFIDGVFYSRDRAVISINSLRETIGTATEDVFVKKDNSNKGKGVVRLAYKEISEARFHTIGNCVIQSAIQQHESFDRMITGSVATVRLTTVKESDGSIGLRASYLRLGRKNTAWVQSGNSVRVPITSRLGELDSFGYTQDWRRWLKHPDTGVAFAGKHVPKFETLMETCLALHAKVPHFTIIGWDMTVDRDESVKVIEWNGGHCDIKFSEATTGPCFTGLNWERLRD